MSQHKNGFQPWGHTQLISVTGAGNTHAQVQRLQQAWVTSDVNLYSWKLSGQGPFILL